MIIVIVLRRKFLQLGPKQQSSALIHMFLFAALIGPLNDKDVFFNHTIKYILISKRECKKKESVLSMDIVIDGNCNTYGRADYYMTIACTVLLDKFKFMQAKYICKYRFYTFVYTLAGDVQP